VRKRGKCRKKKVGFHRKRGFVVVLKERGVENGRTVRGRKIERNKENYCFCRRRRLRKGGKRGRRKETSKRGRETVKESARVDGREGEGVWLLCADGREGAAVVVVLEGRKERNESPTVEVPMRRVFAEPQGARYLLNPKVQKKP
jgi:hypothetical protein